MKESEEDEVEEDITTEREADLKNKIQFIRGAIQKLKYNVPTFIPVYKY